MPTVSVIMPVYNGEQYLAESINSLLDQTFIDWELIIVDDGSTDQTSQIVRSFSQKDSRIRLVNHANNLGLVASLNDALLATAGKLIARQDADDLSAPERLERMVRFFQENLETGLIGSNGYYLDEGGKVVGDSDFPLDHEGIRKAILVEKSPFFHGSWMFRRECIEKVGLYNSLLFSGEDKDYWLRVGEQYETGNLPDKLYYYRVHANAFTSQFSYPRKMLREMIVELARERLHKGTDSIDLTYGGYFDQSQIPESLKTATRQLTNSALLLQQARYWRSINSLLSASMHGVKFPVVRKMIAFVISKYVNIVRKRIRSYF